MHNLPKIHGKPVVKAAERVPKRVGIQTLLFGLLLESLFLLPAHCFKLKQI